MNDDRKNAETIPADSERHPAGCPDPDWCRGNRCCYWRCVHDGDEDWSEDEL